MKENKNKNLDEAIKKNNEISASDDKEYIKGTIMRPNESSTERYAILFSKISRSNWKKAYKEILKITKKTRKIHGLNYSSGEMPVEYLAQVNEVLLNLSILFSARVNSESEVLSKYLAESLTKTSHFLVKSNLEIFEEAAKRKETKQAIKNVTLGTEKIDLDYKKKLIRSINRSMEIDDTKKHLGKLSPLRPESVRGEIEQSLTHIVNDFSKRMKKAVYKSITTHQHPSTLPNELKNIFGMTDKQAKNAAIRLTGNAFAEIERINLREAGIKEFEWIHSSGSSRPRKLHVEMNGDIFSFDNPPIIDLESGRVGFPGDEYNCRCALIPVVEITDQ